MASSSRLIADFEIQIEDMVFELLENALEKFKLDVAPNKIVSFLDIVCEEFDDNLMMDEKHLVAFTMRRILIAAFECVRSSSSVADDDLKKRYLIYVFTLCMLGAIFPT